MIYTKKIKKGTTRAWLIKEIEGTRSGAHLLTLKTTIVSELKKGGDE